MSRFEYRVRWEREGGGRAITRIYQTEQAALHKIHGILALEEIKDRTERWANSVEYRPDVRRWFLTGRGALAAGPDAEWVVGPLDASSKEAA